MGCSNLWRVNLPCSRMEESPLDGCWAGAVKEMDVVKSRATTILRVSENCFSMVRGLTCLKIVADCMRSRQANGTDEQCWTVRRYWDLSLRIWLGRGVSLWRLLLRGF